MILREVEETPDLETDSVYTPQRQCVRRNLHDNVRHPLGEHLVEQALEGRSFWGSQARRNGTAIDARAGSTNDACRASSCQERALQHVGRGGLARGAGNPNDGQ